MNELEKLKENAGIIDSPGNYAYKDDELGEMIDYIVTRASGDAANAKELLRSIEYNVMQRIKLGGRA